jgi:predicted nuclease with TOPRIM domain
MSDYDTRPTIETLLEEMKKGFAAMAEQFNEVFRRLDLLESRLERTERRQSLQDEKLDLFIAEVVDLKRQMRHPV